MRSPFACFDPQERLAIPQVNRQTTFTSWTPLSNPGAEIETEVEEAPSKPFFSWRRVVSVYDPYMAMNERKNKLYARNNRGSPAHADKTVYVDGMYQELTGVPKISLESNRSVKEAVIKNTSPARRRYSEIPGRADKDTPRNIYKRSPTDAVFNNNNLVASQEQQLSPPLSAGWLNGNTIRRFGNSPFGKKFLKPDRSPASEESPIRRLARSISKSKSTAAPRPSISSGSILYASTYSPNTQEKIEEFFERPEGMDMEMYDRYNKLLNKRKRRDLNTRLGKENIFLNEHSLNSKTTSETCDVTDSFKTLTMRSTIGGLAS